MYSFKNASFQELQRFNDAIDKTVLYAILDDGGTVMYLSKKFQKLLGITSNHGNKSIEEVNNQ